MPGSLAAQTLCRLDEPEPKTLRENKMLTRVFQLLLLSGLVTGTLRAENNPFIGDWKLNPSRSQLTDQMKVASVGANKYTFDFGGGAETIVVDGTDQSSGFGTTLSVTVEGPDSWKVVRKKEGRMLLSAIWKLSSDNNTLEDDFTFFPSNGSPTTVNYIYKRTAGGTGFAGTWLSKSATMASGYSLQVRPYEGDGLSFKYSSNGVIQNVKFDGGDYAMVAPIEGYTSSARRVNERTLEITYKVKGKIGDTQTIELSSDLKTLTMTRHTGPKSEPYIEVFERQ
jgi:hypothetical protein